MVFVAGSKRLRRKIADDADDADGDILLECIFEEQAREDDAAGEEGAAAAEVE